MTCADCDQPQERRGYCDRHYRRALTDGRLRRAIASDDEPAPAPANRWLPWAVDAKCIQDGIATELFFPEGQGDHTADLAKRVCAGCSVREVCLDTFLFERDGIVGGTTPRERQKIRQEREAA